MITNIEQLREILRTKAIKPTYQRLKILNYVKENRNHPTVDMIYRDIVKVVPTMSKTTVYNTLKSFADAGIVMPVVITGTGVRFDFGGINHHHLLCEKCRNIIDLKVECPNAKKKEMCGNIVKEVHGYFKGICSACAKKT